MSSDLSPETIKQISAAVENAFSKERERYWIEPEMHYRQHIQMGEVLEAFKQARNLVARFFIGLVVIGLFTAALFAIKGKI